MSKEKDDIKKVSLPNAKKRKRVPDYGRPERRKIGWNDEKFKTPEMTGEIPPWENE